MAMAALRQSTSAPPTCSRAIAAPSSRPTGSRASPRRCAAARNSAAPALASSPAAPCQAWARWDRPANTWWVAEGEHAWWVLAACVAVGVGG